MSRASVAGSSPGTDLAGPDRGDVNQWRGAAVAVFLIGLVARIAQVWHGAGPGSDLGYDPAVYFAAADGLVHGRLPYHDFVLLHPPGLMLALSPFAFATRFVSDQTAFILANLAFTVLGALNAMFVVHIGRKLGLSLFAAVGGGLFAALWLGSVHAEYMARLEPLANLFVLVALYAYAAARRNPSARWLFVMGAGLGAATSVKIWYVVPLVVLLGWAVVSIRARREVVAAICGAAVAMIAINAFFFWRAPTAMWRMVVADQLGRSRFDASPITRFDQANDVITWHRLLGPVATGFAVVVLILGSLLLLTMAWTHPAGRPLVALVAAQLVVLALSPSWFGFYADYLTPAFALAVAAGVEAIRRAQWTSTRTWRHSAARVGPAAVAVALIVLVAPLTWQRAGLAFPSVRLAAAVKSSPCVVSDSPMALIELNALSRSFAPGCRDWVDVVGRTYGADRSNATRPNNPAWQRDLTDYLLSGDAFIVIRPSTGLSRATRAKLVRRAVIARAGVYVVFRGRSVAG
jgi:alpha-1,2-mannosyltransferase